MRSHTAAGSLALLTDLYQLTMAYGYWKAGMAEHEAVFHLFFRNNPFGGGFTLTCGQEAALDFLEAFRFEPGDLDYLATLQGSDEQPLFSREFLAHLGALRLQLDVDAMPEGTVAFPHEPIVRVRGSLLQCQLLETALLNFVNFQSLIATKAARVCMAARGAPVLEFGLRRAQGTDGALAASRAAYVGGCAATSNVLAGKLYGVPVRGTHAHSWVMSFDTEHAAFAAYAAAMPGHWHRPGCPARGGAAASPSPEDRAGAPRPPRPDRGGSYGGGRTRYASLLDGPRCDWDSRDLVSLSRPRPHCGGPI